MRLVALLAPLVAMSMLLGPLASVPAQHPPQEVHELSLDLAAGAWTVVAFDIDTERSSVILDVEWTVTTGPEEAAVYLIPVASMDAFDSFAAVAPATVPVSLRGSHLDASGGDHAWLFAADGRALVVAAATAPATITLTLTVEPGASLAEVARVAGTGAHVDVASSADALTTMLSASVAGVEHGWLTVDIDLAHAQMVSGSAAVITMADDAVICDIAAIGVPREIALDGRRAAAHLSRGMLGAPSGDASITLVQAGAPTDAVVSAAFIPVTKIDGFLLSGGYGMSYAHFGTPGSMGSGCSL